MASSTSNTDLPTPDISFSSVKPKELIPNRQEFNWQDEQAILIRANISDSHPTSRTERLIDLAERVLAHGYSEEGHHESVRKRMEAWLDRRSDNPREDPYRRVVVSIQPSERARFSLTGTPKEKYEKAVTILAWGVERYGKAQIEELQADQQESLRTAWCDAIEKETAEQMGKRFADDPPDRINGWCRLDTRRDDIVVAYEGQSKNRTHVGLLYRTEQNGLETKVVAKVEWMTHDRDSAATPVADAVIHRDVSPSARLYNYLKQHDVESPADSELAV